MMFVTIFLSVLSYNIASALTQKGLSSLDRQQVFNQLGYVPSNVVAVVARSSADGQYYPVVLQTYPLAGGSARRQARSAAMDNSDCTNTTSIGTPFPTLYWLCHPAIHKAVADLERRGYVNMIERDISLSAELCNDLLECHRQYAADRWNSLSKDDQHMLMMRNEKSSMGSKRRILQATGIAGTNITAAGVGGANGMKIPYVKCLHAHYAHYRAATATATTMVTTKTTNHIAINPVGKIVHELLRTEFPSLIL
jgi:hypothetical protein